MRHLKKGGKGWTQCGIRPKEPHMTLTERIKECECIDCLRCKRETLEEEILKKNKQTMECLRREIKLKPNEKINFKKMFEVGD